MLNLWNLIEVFDMKKKIFWNGAQETRILNSVTAHVLCITHVYSQLLIKAKAEEGHGHTVYKIIM